MVIDTLVDSKLVVVVVVRLKMFNRMFNQSCSMCWRRIMRRPSSSARRRPEDGRWWQAVVVNA